MSSTSEVQLISTSYSAEISWLDYEIRQAERAYYQITRRGPLSDHECAELDAIDAYIQTKKWEIKHLMTEATERLKQF